MTKGSAPRQPGRLQRAGASACARDEKQASGAPETVQCALGFSSCGEDVRERPRKEMQMKRWLPFQEERAL